MILEQYDREPWGILRPDHVVKRRDGFPETVVFEFSEAVIRETARLAGGGNRRKTYQHRRDYPHI